MSETRRTIRQRGAGRECRACLYCRRARSRDASALETSLQAWRKSGMIGAASRSCPEPTGADDTMGCDGMCADA